VFDGFMRLTKTFSAEEYAEGLESWSWLSLARKVPVGTSLFGDILFAAADGCWFLDSIAGSLVRPWADQAAMHANLSTPEGQERYLLASLAEEVARRGVIPGPSQVYDFAHPPVLGGRLEADNVYLVDFVVALNVAGQIHDQVRSET
jgi:hypothetical protein